MLFVAIPCSSLVLAVPSDGLSRRVLSMCGLSLKGMEKQREARRLLWDLSFFSGNMRQETQVPRASVSLSAVCWSL